MTARELLARGDWDAAWFAASHSDGWLTVTYPSGSRGDELWEMTRIGNRGARYYRRWYKGRGRGGPYPGAERSGSGIDR